jgi:hypothetical protein
VTPGIPTLGEFKDRYRVATPFTCLRV